MGDGARSLRTRSGRPAVTSKDEISRIALRLFSSRGFEATTVDDIAAAAGIGRRTFFRYFSSKNDLAWGDFDAQLERMRRYLRDRPSGEPIAAALHGAVLDFNSFAAEEMWWHRRRMTLILTVPALQAHSTLRYNEWREVVAGYVAGRLGVLSDDLVPQAVAYALLGICVAAYQQWLRDADADLDDLLDASLGLLERGFDLG